VEAVSAGTVGDATGDVVAGRQRRQHVLPARPARLGENIRLLLRRLERREQRDKRRLARGE
jgi:hypothetical protein